SEPRRPKTGGRVREARRGSRAAGSAGRRLRVSDEARFLVRANGLPRLPARVRDGPGRALHSATNFLKPDFPVYDVIGNAHNGSLQPGRGTRERGSPSVISESYLDMTDG